MKRLYHQTNCIPKVRTLSNQDFQLSKVSFTTLYVRVTDKNKKS